MNLERLVQRGFGIGHAVDHWVQQHGLPEIIAKPWVAQESNALDGERSVVFVEDMGQG